VTRQFSNVQNIGQQGATNLPPQMFGLRQRQPAQIPSTQEFVAGTAERGFSATPAQRRDYAAQQEATTARERATLRAGMARAEGEREIQIAEAKGGVGRYAEDRIRREQAGKGVTEAANYKKTDAGVWVDTRTNKAAQEHVSKRLDENQRLEARTERLVGLDPTAETEGTWRKQAKRYAWDSVTGDFALVDEDEIGGKDERYTELSKEERDQIGGGRRDFKTRDAAIAAQGSLPKGTRIYVDGEEIGVVE